MTDFATLNALAERIENSDGPSRELDIAVALALPKWAYGDHDCKFFNAGPYYEGAEDRIGLKAIDGSDWSTLPGNSPDMLVPEFTNSIDAALKIVDDQLITVVLQGAIQERLDLCFNPLDNYLTKLKLFVCAAALRASAANE